MVMFTSFSDYESADVKIQYEDRGGNWVTVSTCPNQWPVIDREIDRATFINRSVRVRAVDPDGRLLALRG